MGNTTKIIESNGASEFEKFEHFAKAVLAVKPEELPKQKRKKKSRKQKKGR